MFEALWAMPSLQGRVRFVRVNGERVEVSLTLVLPPGELSERMLQVALATLLPGLNPCADEPPPEGRNAAEQDAAAPEGVVDQLAFKCPGVEAVVVLLEEATLAGGYACGACRNEGGSITLVLEFAEAAAAKAAREAAGGLSPAAQFRARPRVAALL